MDKFSEKDLEFLNQGELFYSGGQPTWSDAQYDAYRKTFEEKYGPVTDYMKSLNQGKHVSHRPSGRFRLTKVAIDHQFDLKCKELMSDKSDRIYWMYKYDGCSLVAYYNNGKLVQVCTKSAVEWGIDRTPILSYLFPQVVSPDIDSIQGEAVVKVSEVGGEYAARSSANGLINSKYKVDEVHRLINVRAFKVGFKDLDPSVDRMIKALKSLPIPEHGKFQIAKEIGPDDVSDSAIGSEDILYDGIVKYDMDTDQILGYKRHSDEHLVTKITYIEWNKSSKGLMVPKFNFEPVYFNAQYDDDGNIIGGIKTQRASCGSANRLFSLKAGAGAIVEVYRANSTIPQVSKVISTSSDYCLNWLDEHYYDKDYEFNCNQDPWKVIANKGYYCFGGGIKCDETANLDMEGNIKYWYPSVQSWWEQLNDDPWQFCRFLYYKTPLKKHINTIDKANLIWYLNEITSGDSSKFDEFTQNIVNWLGKPQFRDSMMSIKDELMNLIAHNGLSRVEPKVTESTDDTKPTES